MKRLSRGGEGAEGGLMVFEEVIGQKADPSVRVMNLLGYDAMAVGNHEFDFGRPRLEQSRRQARFPWLSANVMGQDGQAAFPPHLVHRVHFDPTRPEGERVLFLRRGGRPVGEAEVFTVAINSYRRTPLHLEKNDNWFLAPTLPEGRRAWP